MLVFVCKVVLQKIYSEHSLYVLNEVLLLREILYLGFCVNVCVLSERGP